MTRPDLVLASGSPRRLELVRRMGLEPAVRVSDVVEEHRRSESPDAYTLRLAEEKARDVAGSIEDTDLPRWVLAADTTVAHEAEVLDKPADEAEAREMLRSLSGTVHAVATSYCWLDRERAAAHSECVTTRVTMRGLTEEEIEAYLDSGEPFDKAGSYGIQGLGGLFVDHLEGSYFNVMGLPVARVFETAASLGAGDVHPLLAADDIEPPNRDSSPHDGS